MSNPARVINVVEEGEFICYTYDENNRLIRLERKDTYASIFAIYSREKHRLGKRHGGIVFAIECDTSLPERALEEKWGPNAPFAFAYSLPEIDLRSRLVGFIVKSENDEDTPITKASN